MRVSKTALHGAKLKITGDHRAHVGDRGFLGSQRKMPIGPFNLVRKKLRAKEAANRDCPRQHTVC